MRNVQSFINRGGGGDDKADSGDYTIIYGQPVYYKIRLTKFTENNLKYCWFYGTFEVKCPRSGAKNDHTWPCFTITDSSLRLGI